MPGEVDAARRETAVVITCEHGGNEVPDAHRGLFAGAEDALASHRGWDAGSLGVGTSMAARLSAPLIVCMTTRLLVEPNRSVDHPEVFSVYTRGLSEAAKQDLVDTIYTPHRASVERAIRRGMAFGQHVVHVGVHSFTDVLDGVTRDVDLGVLFDPERLPEAEIAGAWLGALRQSRAGLCCRPNEPYLGTDDGLTTTLRTTFPPASYTGLEIEVRQGLIGGADEQRTMGELLARALDETL